jgi:NAD(P)-dependent dehydrogenase (short-subunit alcohol dehydrogenase family)
MIYRELERASADLLRRGLPVLAVPCDLTHRAEVEAMMAPVDDHFGQINVLVNNAAVIEVGPLEVMKLEDFEEALRTGSPRQAIFKGQHRAEYA